MTEQHAELKDFLPEKKPPQKRMMIAIDRTVYDKISEIAKEMESPRSKTIGALVDFYLAGE
jgi:hypothetical protein